MPSRPMAVLAAELICVLYALVPAGRLREAGKLIVIGLLVVTALSRLYLAQDAPSDAVNGVVFGVAIPLAMFRFFTPTAVYPVSYRRGRTAHLDISGRRLEAIERALHDQLGVIPVEVKPFGLSGSGGSTPMRVKVKGEPESYLFAKLYAVTHVRSDRWYKLGRTLMYGRLEDEKAFNTVRRLVQYEDYMLRLMRDAGLPVPQPYGIVEITPGAGVRARRRDARRREGDSARPTSTTRHRPGLAVVAQALGRRPRPPRHQAGQPHGPRRHRAPDRLRVRRGAAEPVAAGGGPGQHDARAGLRNDVRNVYERAQRVFSIDEITEAFAVTRGLTMPSQLRAMMRQQGKDLHAEFCALLPTRPHPVRIQRWSLRRVALTVWVLFVAWLAALVAFELLKSPL
jgi:hypothetical protein